MKEKIKRLIDKVLGHLLLGGIIAIFIGLIGFFWWLDHIRFVY